VTRTPFELSRERQARTQAFRIPFLTKYHEHVTHVHVNDRKYDGATVPFGQGDVPIVEALQLIKRNKCNLQATIDFEHPVPARSDTLTELTKCVDYCRKALS
jgi:sugar phosphate isomerase/epimerase